MRILSRAGVAFGTAATLALSMQIAFGAVRDTQEDTPPADWTGFYVGTDIGLGRTDTTADTTGNDMFEFFVPRLFPGSLGLSGDGIYGGLTAGYNLQLNRVIFGVEADIAYMGPARTGSHIAPPIINTPQFKTEAQHQMEFFGTLRGRVGVALSRKAMIFGTAGLAAGYVNYQTSVADVDIDPVPGLYVWSGEDKGIKSGWTVGAGGEYQITEKLTLKVDGLYYSLPDSSAVAIGNEYVETDPTFDLIAYESKIENNGVIGRIGVNYRF